VPDYLLQLLPSPSNQTLYQSATAAEKRDHQMEKESSSKDKKKRKSSRIIKSFYSGGKRNCVLRKENILKNILKKW
jgi:hypothetical protein